MIDPRILVGGGLLALIAGFAAGWQVQGWRCDARVADIENTMQAQKDALQDALNQSATDFEQTRADTVRATIRDRETLRVIYRDIQVPADCALPADAVRLLDNARHRANDATGEPSQPLPTSSPAAGTNAGPGAG